MAEDAAYASDRIERHTGVRPPLDDPYMARGCILGIVKVMACLDLATYERVRSYSIDHDVVFATVAGAVDRGSMSVNHLSRTASPWATGPYCWCVENVRRLPPTQAQGRLGLYNLDTVHGIPVDEWVKREAVRV